MPMRSKAQWRFLYARHPRIAKRFAHHTKTSYKRLPARKAAGARKATSARRAGKRR